MTLQLKKCISLFICLSLLVSACSPGKSSKANELARNKVKLVYDLCASEDNVIVDAGKSITFIGKMECTTENGSTICKDTKNNSECELTKVELCNELGEDCKDFKFDVTPVPCGPSDKSEGACLPMRLRGEESLEKLEELARHGALTPNQQKRMAKWARERLMSEEEQAELATLSPKQQDEYLELKSKVDRAKRRVLSTLSLEQRKRVKSGALKPADKEAAAAVKEAAVKALTPNQQEKMAVLTELMQMRATMVVTDLTPKQQEELATLLVKGVKALTPEEQERREALTKLMLVTPEEEAEFNRMNAKVESQKKKEFSDEEREKFLKLVALPSWSPKQQEEWTTLLEKEKAGKKALTEGERAKFEVLLELIGMAPKERKRLLAKMKATDVRERTTLLVKMNDEGKKALLAEERAEFDRIDRKVNMKLALKLALTEEEREKWNTLHTTVMDEGKKALTPEQQKRRTELENLLQEKK